ncbi:TonB-dependent siderophore receptor [Brucella sp. BE17]|uniref:TonB-dependent siderophore receptor n=1 Tax=Brucella sp. BE17 TaxID=3142977 RepID=UPI0031BB749B
MHIENTFDQTRATRLRYRHAMLLGCTALALLPGIALAQETGTGAETVLQTITVDGNGGDDDSRSIVATKTTVAGKMPAEIIDTPASVSVITAKEIKERNAQTVEQVLQYTAGINTDYYGSDDRYDYFKIRGFDAFTYRDGLVIGRPFGGVREDPFAYERIEVLKGSNSAGFGTSQPGGAVNYVTKRPKSERFGEAYITGGSFKHKEVGLDFGDNITKDDELSYRLTGKLQASDAEYDYSRNDEKFFMGGLTWRPDAATSLSLVYDHLYRNGTPGSGGQPIGTDFSRSRFFGEPDFNYRGTKRNSLTAMFDHDFGNGLSFSTNARYSKTNSTFGYAYIDGIDPSGPTLATRSFFGNENTTEQFIIDSHFLYEASFDNIESRTLVGIDYNNFKEKSATSWGPAPSIDWENPFYSGGPASTAPYTSTQNKQKTTGLYLQQDTTFYDKVIVSIGLRNDWLDLTAKNRLTDVTETGDHSEFTKRFGVTYKVTDEIAPYVSYAETVAPAGVGVDPTTGKQYEIGIKYQPNAFPALFTASIYDLTMENFTVYDSVTYLPASVEKVRHRGVDLEAKAEVTKDINVIAAYSYIDSKIEEPGGIYDGNRLSMVPKHMASIWGTYTWEGSGARGDMTFGLGARYVSSYYLGNNNNPQPKTGKGESSVVFDAAYTYNIKENTALQVNVSNLFNEKHVANGGAGALFYNPGREITATLRQTW